MTAVPATIEGLLRSVVDSLDARMCVLGDRGRIVGTNRLWDEFTLAMGWDAGESGIGADFFVLLRQIRGELRGPLTAAVRDVLNVDAQPSSLKGYLPVGGGGEDVVVRLHPVLDRGRARAVLTMIDITEPTGIQRELRRITDEAARQAKLLADQLTAEKALLSEVLGSIPHLVYWKDAELRYTGVNPAFLWLRGLLDESVVLGRTEAELAALALTGPERDRDELSTVLSAIEPQVLAGGDPVENQRVLMAGTTLLLGVFARTDEDGKICGVIGVGADVTHVTRLEQQLAQASRLESIGQLAAGIAHEINTPVQYVSDNTRFLAETFGGVLSVLRAVDELATGPDPLAVRLRELVAGLDLDFIAEEIPSALSQSQEGLTRVAQIVRAMKDFSHPGQGRAQADLNRAVESTVQVSRNEWRYVARLDLDLDPDVGLVRCFEGELKQVLLNIVVNAAQAIGSQRENVGGQVLGSIQIRTQRLEQGVRITVSDDGPGMDAAVRDKIFDPFFTTKPVGQGTGQGLSMAYVVIVQKHGGRLDVTSVPGAGSTFTIDLPDEAVD